MDKLNAAMESISITTETGEPFQENGVVTEEAFQESSLTRADISDSLYNNGVDGFGFKMHHGRKLKLAVQALADPMFNPTGIGRMDVDNSGFRVTAMNGDVHGNLILTAEGLDNFRCGEPLLNKSFDLLKLVKILNLLGADDEDTITFIHRQGSNHFSVIFGYDHEHVRGFAVQFCERFHQILRFPSINPLCEAIGISDELEPFINHMYPGMAEELNLVTIEITDKSLKMMLPDETMLYQEYEKMGFDGIFHMRPGQQHHAWLYLPYPEALRKAACIGAVFHVGLIVEPQHRVIMGFPFTEDQNGGLAFIKNAANMVKNVDEYVLRRRQKNASVPLPKSFWRRPPMKKRKRRE